MQKLSACLLRFAALTAWTAMTFGQTPAMLTLHVKTPDGTAIPSADVMIQSAQPSEPVRVWARDLKTNKSGIRAHTPLSFITKTDADGQVQTPKAELEREFPSGKVVVSVRAAGYEPYKQDFDLADQKPLEIVLHPLPPQQ